MLAFYDRLFYCTLLIMEEDVCIEDGSVSVFQVLSVILCLVLTHFLFIFSLTILIFPEHSHFEVGTIIVLVSALAAIFSTLFFRANRYRDVLIKYQAIQGKSFRFAVYVYGCMILTFFLMATREIIKAL